MAGGGAIAKIYPPFTKLRETLALPSQFKSIHASTVMESTEDKQNAILCVRELIKSLDALPSSYKTKATVRGILEKTIQEIQSSMAVARAVQLDQFTWSEYPRTEIVARQKTTTHPVLRPAPAPTRTPAMAPPPASAETSAPTETPAPAQARREESTREQAYVRAMHSAKAAQEKQPARTSAPAPAPAPTSAANPAPPRAPAATPTSAADTQAQLLKIIKERMTKAAPRVRIEAGTKRKADDVDAAETMVSLRTNSGAKRTRKSDSDGKRRGRSAGPE